MSAHEDPFMLPFFSSERGRDRTGQPGAGPRIFAGWAPGESGDHYEGCSAFRVRRLTFSGGKLSVSVAGCQWGKGRFGVRRSARSHFRLRSFAIRRPGSSANWCNGASCSFTTISVCTRREGAGGLGPGFKPGNPENKRFTLKG